MYEHVSKVTLMSRNLLIKTVYTSKALSFIYTIYMINVEPSFEEICAI